MLVSLVCQDKKTVLKIGFFCWVRWMLDAGFSILDAGRLSACGCYRVKFIGRCPMLVFTGFQPVFAGTGSFSHSDSFGANSLFIPDFATS